MADLAPLTPGLTGTAELIVGEEHTAIAAGSGRVRVFATPVMVRLMEQAALGAVETLLPAGYQSVGIRLDVSHDAATPVGARVTATARLLAVEGRTLRFSVSAHDEVERIGQGTHERVVVDTARFMARVQAKARHP